MRIMKTIGIMIIAGFSISCSTSPSKDDPIQRSIDLIIEDVSNHKYSDALNKLKLIAADNNEITYFVAEYDDVPKYQKVTFKMSDLELFLVELSKVRKLLEDGCGPESPEIAKALKDEIEAHKYMGHGTEKTEVLKHEISKDCYDRSTRFTFIRRIHSRIDEELRLRPWDYFRQGNNDIFGEIIMKQCGDDHPNSRTLIDVYECLLAEHVKRSNEEFRELEENDYKMKIDKSKQNKKQALDRQDKEDKDGTSVFKSYCWTLQVLKKSNEEIARQKEIGKEVGFVDTKLLYDYGQTVVDFKARKLAQEKEYLRLAGKKIDSTKCSELNGY